MKKLISSLIAVLTLFCIILPASAAVQLKSVKSTTTDPCDISVIRVYLSSLGTKLYSVEMNINGNYYLKETSKGLSLSNAVIKLKDNKLYLLNSDGETIYSGKEISICRRKQNKDAGYITILNNERSYLGDFRFKIMQKDSGNYIQIINHVPTAYYLYGVLAGEMSESWGSEALKCQAIAAKNYVLALKLNTEGYAEKNTNYDLGDTSSNQVYKGYSSSWINIISAVNSTINKTLMVDGKLLRTYYGATNGGETTLPSDAWRSTADSGYALRIDNFDFNSEYYRETLNIKLNQPVNNVKLNKLLMSHVSSQLEGEETLSEILSVCDVFMDNPKYEGSIRNLTSINFELSIKTNLEELKKVYVSFDPEELLENGIFEKTRYNIYWGCFDTESNSYNVYHVRFGHGVGLSQCGARYRDKCGQKYDEILSFYYPGAELKNINIGMPKDDEVELNPESVSAVSVKINEKMLKGKKTDRENSSTQKQNSDVLNSTNINPSIFAGNDAETKKVLAYAYITQAGAEFKAAANNGAEVLKFFEYGDVVTVLNIGQWCRVESDDVCGYINQSDIKFLTKNTETITYKVGIINASYVNFRSEATTSGEPICKIMKNDTVYVWGVTEQKDWYYVQYGLKYGYVYAEYVNAEETYIASGVAEGSIIASGLTNDSVNLRPDASTSNTALATIPAGTYVLVYSYENGWYKVLAQGKTGYLRGDYVEINTAIPIAPVQIDIPVSPQPIGMGVINATDVRFRSEPNKTCEIIGLLQKDEKLSIYSQEGEWYYAKYRGIMGYVFSQYIDVTLNSDTQKEADLELYTGITTGSVNFREKATTNSSKITTLKYNTVVDIIGETNNWYFVYYDGNYGFLSKKYTKINSVGNIDIMNVDDDWSAYDTKTNDSVNLRKGPATAYSVIMEIAEGKTVKVLAVTENNNDYWCLIRYNNKLGFVSYSYLNER